MMKLRNILFAGLAVVLLATGCSKDDGDGPVGPEANTKINIKIAASSLGTKADDDPERLPGESVLNNVAAIVFSEDGTSLLGEPVWETLTNADGSATMLNIPAKTAKAQILILANCPENLFDGVSSYAGMQSKLAHLADQKQNNMTMSTQLIKTVDALVKDDNYLGYESVGNGNINGISKPVELTRLAARLDLSTITTSFAGGKLAGRTVRIDEISVGNQKNASHFFSNDYWGAVMADSNLGTSAITAIDRTVSDNSSLSDVIYRKYVMENTDANNATQLLIKATILAIPGFGAETKIFAATVNLNGVVVVGEKHKYVKRNYVYRIKVNFSGTSFSGDPETVNPDPDPEPPIVEDDASLDVQVEVVGWGEVNGDYEIE